MRQPNDRVEILGAQHRARRIRWRVEDNRLGLVRDCGFDALHGNAKVLRLVGLEEHWRATRKLDNVLVRNPERHRHDDLIAVLDQHLDGVEDCQLAAGREHALIGRVVGTEVCRVALQDRLAHFRRTGHGRVARNVLLNGLDRRILNMLRRGEVGLARAKVRQINALRLQLERFGGDGHGGRNFDPIDPVGEDFRSCRCTHN